MRHLVKLKPRELAETLSLAILFEASSYPKPGNVHRLRDRPDLKYEYFLVTGVYATKYFEKGIRRGLRSPGKLVVGDIVYGLIRDIVDRAKATNTCLGSALLMGLMSVSLGRMLRDGEIYVDKLSIVEPSVVENTTVYDTVYYYKAIRKAAPSYLKPSDNTGEYVNVWDPAYRRKLMERNHNLHKVLLYSSKFDIVADEAINGFKRAFKAEEFLRERLGIHGDFNRAVVETYLYLLSENIDTVVYLKHGLEVAREISEKARVVLESILSKGHNWMSPVWRLDDYLYNRGINPGSIADLVATTIAIYLVRRSVNE